MAVAGNAIKFTLKESKATTVVLTGTKSDGSLSGSANVTLTSGTETKTITATVNSGELSKDFTIGGLTPATTYAVTYSGDIAPSGSVTSVTTLADEPKTATESQWQDLANRVKAKSDVQITMTNTDPGEGSALAENNYVAVYGGDPIIMDYSTSEINTGAKWVDGSAIYKKTISIGAVNTNSSAVIAHGISSFATFVKSEAWGSFGNTSSGYFWFAIPWSGSNYVSLTVDETNVTVESTIGNNITSCYVTLYYTKNS